MKTKNNNSLQLTRTALRSVFFNLIPIKMKTKITNASQFIAVALLACTLGSCQLQNAFSDRRAKIKEDKVINISGRESRTIRRQQRNEGWSVDWALGSARTQAEREFVYRNSKNADGKPKWILETFTNSSGDLAMAQEKTRDQNRNQFGKNAGSFFDGKIEIGSAYLNFTGEDISSELREAIGAENEIFSSELSRNHVVTRYFKREGQKYFCKLTAALDASEFEANIKKLTKAELRARIEKVRKNHEESVSEKKN